VRVRLAGGDVREPAQLGLAPGAGHSCAPRTVL